MHFENDFHNTILCFHYFAILYLLYYTVTLKQVWKASQHSIFHSTHFLEEITRLTLETKRTEFITDLGESRKERKNVGMCLLSKKKRRNKTTSTSLMNYYQKLHPVDLGFHLG